MAAVVQIAHGDRFLVEGEKTNSLAWNEAPSTLSKLWIDKMNDMSGILNQTEIEKLKVMLYADICDLRGRAPFFTKFSEMCPLIINGLMQKGYVQESFYERDVINLYMEQEARTRLNGSLVATNRFEPFKSGVNPLLF